MNIGDRLVCVLPNFLSADASFSVWPLHITIVPWFRSPQSTKVLVDGLDQVLADMEKFKVQMGEQAVKLGHQKGKLATLIQLPTPLMIIEERVRNFLHDQKAWIVDESTKQKLGYRPHVTNQGTQLMYFGDRFMVDRLYIIEQVGGFKRIAGEVLLSV